MIVKCKGNSKDKKKKSGEEKATFYNWYTSLSPIFLQPGSSCSTYKQYDSAIKQTVVFS